MSLKQNLISWWKLDEQSGTRNDAHGTNHLSDNNTVLYAAGKQGDAADFEKSNSEFLSIANNASLNTGGHTDFTFACWVRFESAPTGGDDMVFAAKFDYALETSEEWVIDLYGDGFFYLTVLSGTGDFLFVPGPAATINTWYFVVAWHDATADTINIQVNNGSVASVANANGIKTGSTVPLYLGAVKDGAGVTYPHDGLIDEAAFWKRVLTADERTWLYNSGNGRTYEELASGCIFGLLGIFGGVVR